MIARIPKIIHQTYGKRILPQNIRDNIESLKLLNPDWEYRFYDDNDIEQYISKKFPEYLDLYYKINPKYGAARADLFRYLVMYNEGGCYLDIKSTFSKPLDDVIGPSDEMLLSHWNQDIFKGWGNHPEIDYPSGEFLQCFIIASKKHPYLKEVIKKVTGNISTYSRLKQGVGREGVLRTTGPVAYTLSILPVLELHNHRIVKCEEIGFVYSIFESMTSLQHSVLFKKHYTHMRSPVVLDGIGWYISKIRRKLQV